MAHTDSFAIGIDVGATNTKIGLVQIPSTLLDHQTIPSQLGGSDPVEFITAVGRVVEGYLSTYPVVGIGVSLCSMINKEHTGALLSVNAPALNHLDLLSILQTRFGCPVQISNDVAAYALAEYHYGAGRSVQRMLCLALGTGLAVASINDGRLLETWGGVSADAGRIILQPGANEACKGGVHGSAEALCGTAQIERLARKIYRRETISAREVIQSAQAGSNPAVDVMAEIGHNAGHLLAILAPVFFPQCIVITGGTAEAGEPFFQAIRRRFGELIGPYMAFLSGSEIEIVKGELGPDAAILGSVVGLFK